MKTVFKGKHFSNVEELKQKMAETLNGQKKTKGMSSKTVLSSGKNVSIGILHQMQSTSKVTEV